MVVIPPIFVADTKIIYDYNFIAPILKICLPYFEVVFLSQYFSVAPVAAE